MRRVLILNHDIVFTVLNQLLHDFLDLVLSLLLLSLRYPAVDDR